MRASYSNSKLNIQMQPCFCLFCFALFQMCSVKQQKLSVKLKHAQLGGGDRETSLGLNRAKKNQVDKQNQA